MPRSPTTAAATLLALAALPSVTWAQDVSFSGSASLGYQSTLRSEDRDTILRSLTPEIALKVEADVHDVLSFSGKICYSCHGFEVASAFIDVTPHDAANLKVGRVAIPFGEFSVRYDTASYKAVSKPLPYVMGHMARYRSSEFNLGVLPIPYVDNAAVLYGSVWPTDWLQVSYAAYVAAGLSGDNDFDFQRHRTAFYTDNNSDLARGGRLQLTLAQAPFLPEWFADLSLGASVMNGAYDDDATRDYLIYGVDAAARFSIFALRAEYLVRRTQLDTDVEYTFDLIDDFFTKTGWYVELEHPLFEYVELSYRIDGLKRLGVPLPGSAIEDTDSGILRYTQGLNVVPFDAFKLKLAYEQWWFTDFSNVQILHVAATGSF